VPLQTASDVRKRGGPDLVIRNVSGSTCKTIKVKTSHTDLPGLACTASFRIGNSVQRAVFLLCFCCVFVVFENMQVKELLLARANFVIFSATQETFLGHQTDVF
jgi:hypothetical protein